MSNTPTTFKLLAASRVHGTFGVRVACAYERVGSKEKPEQQRFAILVACPPQRLLYIGLLCVSLESSFRGQQQ